MASLLLPRVALAAAALLLTGCASPPPVAQPRDPEPARARAALATVYVDNRTGERLTIAYRLAARTAPEVIVGTAPAQGVVELAPLPAGEPVVLTARTAGGREASLPPRSFVMDTEWTWLIAAGTRFVAPPERP
jgi:hypothetical protein